MDCWPICACRWFACFTCCALVAHCLTMCLFVCLLACSKLLSYLLNIHVAMNMYVCTYNIYTNIYIYIDMYLYTYICICIYIYTWWLIKILSCRNSHSSPGAGFTFTKLSGTPLSFAGPMLGPILGNNAPYEDSVVICQTIIDLFHDSLVNMQLASRNIRVNHT